MLSTPYFFSDVDLGGDGSYLALFSAFDQSLAVIASLAALSLLLTSAVAIQSYWLTVSSYVYGKEQGIKCTQVLDCLFDRSSWSAIGHSNMQAFRHYHAQETTVC